MPVEIKSRTHHYLDRTTQEPRTIEIRTFTMPVSVGGETRDVEFTVAIHGGHAYSAHIFTSRIGRGAKTHRCGMTAWPEGDEWRISLGSNALNRQCRISGWAEDAAPTSRHHSTD